MQPAQLLSSPGLSSFLLPSALFFGQLLQLPATVAQPGATGMTVSADDGAQLQLERRTLSDPEIDESSGLVASRQHPGVLWTHNDSGDTARIFAIDQSGQTIQTIEVAGARNVDWEDLTIDEFGYLYIGDHGNNNSRRTDLGIYVLREPDPTLDHKTDVLSFLRFIYPDQAQPPTGTVRNFDSEALFYASGDLYLLTKHRMDKFTRLYRLPLLPHDARSAPKAAVSTLELVSSLDMAPPDSQPGVPDRRAMVTAADLSPDGRYLAVLAYGAVVIFEGRPDAAASSDSRPAIDFLARPPLRRIELAPAVAKQCEAIAWLPGGDLVIGNEQQDLLFLRRPLPDPSSTP